MRKKRISGEEYDVEEEEEKSRGKEEARSSED